MRGIDVNRSRGLMTFRRMMCWLQQRCISNLSANEKSGETDLEKISDLTCRWRGFLPDSFEQTKSRIFWGSQEDATGLETSSTLQLTDEKKKTKEDAKESTQYKELKLCSKVGGKSRQQMHFDIICDCIEEANRKGNQSHASLSITRQFSE